MNILFYTDVDGDKEQILSKISEELYKEGYVKETYKEALLKRESEFPTGLNIGDGVGIALPHTDIEHVNKEAMVIIIPKNKVKFNLMDDPQNVIDVSVIFLLVIKDPKGYVKFLSKLTSLFQSNELKDAIIKKDLQKIKQLIEPLIYFR